MMSFSRVVAASLLFLFFSLQAVGFGLLVEEDSYVMEPSPNKETNNDGKLRRRLAVVNLSESVNGWGAGERIAYIKFSLKGLPEFIGSENIVHASLRLFVSEVVSPGSIAVFSVTGPWQEKTLNWSNRPSLGAQIGNASLVENDERRWQEFEATDLMRAWLTLPEANYGIAVRADETAWVMLGSKEGVYTEDYRELKNYRGNETKSNVPSTRDDDSSNTNNSGAGPAGHAASVELLITLRDFD